MTCSRANLTVCPFFFTRIHGECWILMWYKFRLQELGFLKIYDRRNRYQNTNYVLLDLNSCSIAVVLIYVSILGRLKIETIIFIHRRDKLKSCKKYLHKRATFFVICVNITLPSTCGHTDCSRPFTNSTVLYSCLIISFHAACHRVV